MVNTYGVLLDTVRDNNGDGVFELFYYRVHGLDVEENVAHSRRGCGVS